MTQDEATLTAAVVAAAASFLNLFAISRAARRVEHRNARRSMLTAEFNDLGDCLYQLLALSKKMLDSKSDEKFAEIRQKADAISKRVDEMRRRTRYPLWGIDSGFRTMQWMHVYVAHNKNSRSAARPKEIIELGTKLRKAMDKAICHAFFNGEPPTRWQRLWVLYKAWRVRKRFDDGKPVPELTI